MGETKAEYNRRYYAEHREEIAAQKRRYHAANRAARSEYNRRWVAANKAAVREYQRAYRAAHPEARREADRAYRAAAIEALTSLRSHPCTDCGVQYPPAAMEFDHIRGTKKFEITATNYRRVDFPEELAKCDLRCANCHRIRHAEARPSR